MEKNRQEGEPEKTRPDCYKCRWRGEVVGSCHSCCKHPSMLQIADNPTNQLLATFASVQRVPPIAVTSKELNIKASAHGIKSGWFNFPLNFDPIWLENCDGFKSKKKEKPSGVPK